jgi:hypothetical protein
LWEASELPLKKDDDYCFCSGGLYFCLSPIFINKSTDPLIKEAVVTGKKSTPTAEMLVIYSHFGIGLEHFVGVTETLRLHYSALVETEPTARLFYAKRALSLTPGNPELVKLVSELSLNIGESSCAFEELDFFMSDIDIFEYGGVASARFRRIFELRQYAAALKYFELVLDAFANLADGRTARRIYSEQPPGHIEKERAHFISRVRRSLSLTKTKQFAKMHKPDANLLQLVEKIIQMQPDFRMYERFGDVNLAWQRKDMAWSNYRRALTYVGPTDERALNRIEQKYASLDGMRSSG